MERDILKEVENLTEREIRKLELTDEERLILLTHKDISEHILFRFLRDIKNRDLVFEFVKKNRDILERMNIKLYKIPEQTLTDEEELKFISMIENHEINVTAEEKRYILASISEENKEKIKKQFEDEDKKIPDEYKEAFDMPIGQYGEILVDFSSDMERYRGWDDMIRVDATSLSDDERKKFKKLCEICPEMKVYDNIEGIALERVFSTVQEYMIGEKWIEDTLKKLNPQMADVQKVVVIDYLIGQKMSYSPEAGTECEDTEAARTLWKSVVSGYGVCYAIAKIENYMFRRSGLNSKVVRSPKHAFVKVENIELLTDIKGTLEWTKGNTIIDPTWNLADYKFGFMPRILCKSYSEIRKEETSDGRDTMSHKNDEELEDATIGMKRSILKQIYNTLRIVDTTKLKKGPMLYLDIMDISEKNESEETKTKEILHLIQEVNSELSKYQQEVKKILPFFLYDIDFNRSVVDRVYDKSDKEKKPVLYVYMDFPQEGKKFFYLDGEKNSFIEVEQKEFEKRFESYELDIKNNNGLRMWELPSDVEEQKKTEESKKGEDR